MTPRTRSFRRTTIIAGGTALVLVLTIGITSLTWIGQAFPGFFLMANRVVPSIALPDWSSGNPSRLFQHQVVAVDGVPVTSADEVYRLVEESPAGTPFVYTVRSPSGTPETLTVPSREFSSTDYVLLFGAYLLNGFAFLAIGFFVFLLKPGDRASRALLATTGTVGIFVFTAVDLYGPHWFFRLHVLAESLLGATVLHLALVFPQDRIRRHRSSVLTAVYGPFVLLALWYEIVLSSPSAYTTVHLVASATHGIAGGVLVGAIVFDFLASPSALVRRRVGVVALGAFAGLLLPTSLMVVSALFGGSVPLNAGAVTAFLFPLSIGYAIVTRDLFDIDVMLRRALTYTIVVAASALLYFALLAVFGALLPAASAPWSLPTLAWAVLNLAMLYLVAWLRTRVQDFVDRVFFRKAYDSEHVLADLSHALASARSTEEVCSHTLRILGEIFWARSAALLVRDADGLLRDASVRGPGARPVQPGGSIQTRLGRGEILARYEWEDGSGHVGPAIWQALDAEVLAPIKRSDGTFDLLTLGPKASGRPYNVHDIGLLRTAANQVALALSTASAFAQLARLNAHLEEQVRERTQELAAANVELNESLDKLRTAYQRLEASQVSLTRADRLATLGRLTAGIAHEVNTPLGGVLNALKTLTDLGREYADSIDDATVTAKDHHEIADEIVQTAESAAGWARKAASFVSKVKVHGREPGRGAAERFPIGHVVLEIQALLAHRLRASATRIEYAENPEEVSVVGIPSRLGQVLTNLIGNAVDAYEDLGIKGACISVRASREEGCVVVTVADEAGGIPPDVLPHIFDELFTTKEPGRGTGLGLWIARNLIEQEFGGTLGVSTQAGKGSCFTVVLPEEAARPTAGASGHGDAPAPHIVH